MDCEVIGVITEGAFYRYHAPKSVGGVVSDVDGLLYKVLFFAQDPVRCQELVVYEGAEGKDLGRHYVCSQADFVNKFRRQPPRGSQ